MYEAPDIETVREFCYDQVETLWEEILRFENPQTYYVDLSQRLWTMKNDLIEEHMDRV